MPFRGPGRRRHGAWPQRLGHLADADVRGPRPAPGRGARRRPRSPPPSGPTSTSSSSASSGCPFQRELAMGAIGEDGVRVVNDDVVRLSGTSPPRSSSPSRRPNAPSSSAASGASAPCDPACRSTGRTAVIVDDGIATGSTAEAACAVARAHGASPGRGRRPRRLARRRDPPGRRSPTRWSASRRRRRCWPSASGTTTSRRPRTTRWSPCSDVLRTAVGWRTSRRTSPSGRWRCPGPLRAGPAARDRGLRPRQRQQPPQPAQPAGVIPAGFGSRANSNDIQ